MSGDDLQIPVQYVQSRSLTHATSKRRKCARDYAEEYQSDLCCRTIGLNEGEQVTVLVCRFCYQTIGARSDRIKEHFQSKRHVANKIEKLAEVEKLHGQSFPLWVHGQVQHVPEVNVNCIPEHSIENGRLPSVPIFMKKQEFESELQGQSSQLEQVVGSGFVGSASSSSVGWMGQGVNDVKFPLPPEPLVRPPRPKGKLPRVGEEEGRWMVHITWNEYTQTMASSFAKWRHEDSLKEVTFCCEGGLTIKCHKLVLSFCSDYFEKLFRGNPHPFPFIFMKDNFIWEMEAILDFMYLGSMRLQNWQVSSVLKTAEALHIKGLASFSKAQTSTLVHSPPRLHPHQIISQNPHLKIMQIAPKRIPSTSTVTENAETSVPLPERPKRNFSPKLRVPLPPPLTPGPGKINSGNAINLAQHRTKDFHSISHPSSDSGGMNSYESRQIASSTSGGSVQTKTPAKRPRKIAPKRIQRAVNGFDGNKFCIDTSGSEAFAKVNLEQSTMEPCASTTRDFQAVPSSTQPINLQSYYEDISDTDNEPEETLTFHADEEELLDI